MEWLTDLLTGARSVFPITLGAVAYPMFDAMGTAPLDTAQTFVGALSQGVDEADVLPAPALGTYFKVLAGGLINTGTTSDDVGLFMKGSGGGAPLIPITEGTSSLSTGAEFLHIPRTLVLPPLFKIVAAFPKTGLGIGAGYTGTVVAVLLQAGEYIPDV